MKKLALAIAILSLAAAPVFACDHADKQAKEEAPKTAENGKKAPAPKAAPVKEAPKATDKDQKAEKAPVKQEEKKTGEKVSSR